MHRIRLAEPADLPALQELIPLSARRLSQGYYTEAQIESAVRYVFGPDSQLIRDGTYYVAEQEDRVVGCGGWSRRSTLYGGDQAKAAEDPPLDPRTDAARIRAFFVHPDHARQGIGRDLLAVCTEAAARAGFRRLELMATLPGVPLYRRFGFQPAESFSSTLPDGVAVPFVRMTRTLVPASQPPAS